jgi:hypothetical protein
MRKTIPFLISSLMLAGTMGSCDKVNDLLDISFTTDYVEATFTVNPSDAGEYTFTETVMQSDLQQEISDNGGSIGNLKEVTIEEATLEVVSPGKNLDAFSWVEVYVSTPTIAEAMVASIETIPDGQTSVALQLSEEDLKNLLEEDEYTVRVVGELDEPITESIDLKIKIKYDVVVGL